MPPRVVGLRLAPNAGGQRERNRFFHRWFEPHRREVGAGHPEIDVFTKHRMQHHSSMNVRVRVGPARPPCDHAIV